MTRDRAAKKAARIRKADTGESYARSRRMASARGNGSPDGLLSVLGTKGLPTLRRPEPPLVNLRWTVGTDDDGAWVEVGLDGDMPHLLVGGPTASDRTAVVRSMLLQLAFSNLPDGLRLAAVGDPWVRLLLRVTAESGADYSNPWPSDVVAAVDSLHHEWRRRLDLMADNEVPNVEEARARATAEEGSHDAEHPLLLPYCVVVIDADRVREAANGSDRQRVTDRLTQMVQLGRVAGIRLVVTAEDLESTGLGSVLAMFQKIDLHGIGTDGVSNGTALLGNTDTRRFRTLAP